MRRFQLVAMLCLFAIAQSFGKSTVVTMEGIPFHYVDSHILVKVKIDNSEKDYNFIVDTGGLTFIEKAVADELNLKQRGPMAKITSLNASGFQFENVFCFTTFNFEALRKLGMPIHGIIGSDLMEKYKVMLDFHEKLVFWSSDTTSLVPPEKALYFTFRNHPINHAPIIHLKANGTSIEGMVDTGQPYSFVLPIKDFESYQKLDRFDFIRSKGLMIKWPSTSTEVNYLARLGTCEFDDLEITDLLCVFGDPPPMLLMPLIGTDFLSQFQVIINYPRDEMVLIPRGEIHFKSNCFSTGLSLNLSDGDEVFVEGVWENSSADRQNVKVGDRILSFDSKKATSGNIGDLIRLLKDESVKSIVLEVRNENETRTLPLSKAWLF